LAATSHKHGQETPSSMSAAATNFFWCYHFV